MAIDRVEHAPFLGRLGYVEDSSLRSASTPGFTSLVVRTTQQSGAIVADVSVGNTFAPSAPVEAADRFFEIGPEDTVAQAAARFRAHRTRVMAEATNDTDVELPFVDNGDDW